MAPTSIIQKDEGTYNTPPYIIELVIQVLGAIDLDPCADDGKHIPAHQHYTIENNGLRQEWNGHLFINLPQTRTVLWLGKLQEEIKSGRVTEAIALVAVAINTDWLSELLATQAVCFWRGQIQFLDASYLPTAPVQQPYVLVYWGLWGVRFKEVFEEYGVFKPSNDSSTHNRNTNQVNRGKYITINFHDSPFSNMILRLVKIDYYLMAVKQVQQ